MTNNLKQEIIFLLCIVTIKCLINWLFEIALTASNSLLIFYMAAIFKFVMVVYLIYVVIIIINNNITRNEIIDFIDDNNVVHAKSKVCGSAVWQNKTNIEENLKLSSIKTAKGFIYGKFNNQCISVKDKQNKYNNNVLAIGTSGSGKTSTIIMPNIIQRLKQGDSVCVMDDNREIYNKVADYCLRNGIKITTINLLANLNNIGWNFLMLCIDSRTERMDHFMMSSLVDSFYKKTGRGEYNFFDLVGKNTIKVALAYICMLNEEFKFKKYLEIYNEIHEELEDENFILRCTKSRISFVELKNKILKEAELKNKNIKQIRQTLKKIEEIADHDYPINAESLSYTLMNVNKICVDIKRQLSSDQDLKSRWSILCDCTSVFLSGSVLVRKCATQNALLGIKDILDIPEGEQTRDDYLELDKINLEQTAVFIETETFTRNLGYVALLSILDKADKNKSDTLNLNVFVDKFGIAATTNNTAKRLTSYILHGYKNKINFTVGVTCYTELYNKKMGENIIQGACSSVVILGANDLHTCKFVSVMCGEATVFDETIYYKFNFFGKEKIILKTYNCISRPLITVDEVRRLNNKVLVIRNAEQPLLIDQLTWEEFCKENDITTRILEEKTHDIFENKERKRKIIDIYKHELFN